MVNIVTVMYRATCSYNDVQLCFSAGYCVIYFQIAIILEFVLCGAERLQRPTIFGRFIQGIHVMIVQCIQACNGAPVKFIRGVSVCPLQLPGTNILQ